MKNTLLELIPKSLILFLLVSGCQKENPLDKDPANIILGKWELTHSGNGSSLSIKDPIEGYTEFKTDSIVVYYRYSDNTVTSSCKLPYFPCHSKLDFYK